MYKRFYVYMYIGIGHISMVEKYVVNLSRKLIM